MDEVDIDALILENKNKLWLERIALNDVVSPKSVQKSDDVNRFPEAYNTTSKDSFWPCECDLTNVGKSLESSVKRHHSISALAEDTTEKKKSALINKLSDSPPPGSIFVGEKAVTLPLMPRMVRYGEYSPLNPNLLSPGKSLLGLGEYEEKRRQLMNRKKQEYREYLSQARILIKSRDRDSNSTPQKQTHTIRPNQMFFEEEASPPEVNTTQDLKDSTISSFDTVKSGNLIRDTKSVSVQHIHNTNVNDSTLNSSRNELDHGDFININKSFERKYLNPRERKLADLQESNSRHNLSSGIVNGDSELQNQKTNQDAYKEALRQQIEEKRQFDAKIKEKEMLEDNAIARMFEKQQERIRQENLKEEAVRLEKQQRQSRIRTLHRQQEEKMKLSPQERHPSAEQVDLRPNSLETVHNSAQILNVPRSNETYPKTGKTLMTFPIRQCDKLDQTIIDNQKYSTESTQLKSNLRSKLNDMNLDDSLPIPVLRAVSPVIPSLRTTERMQPVSAQTNAMHLLEAKWLVPAVEKNNLAQAPRKAVEGEAGPPRTVLTQLGAIRRQLQLEQMQMEERLQKKREHIIQKPL